MYYFLLLLLLFALFFCIFFRFKRKKIIAKIKCMEKCEKCSLLEELVEPFGYCYYCNYGFFSSTINPWQKEFGYTKLYDKMASRFQMVFDCEPVYFDYDGKTWLIEFWKGQYGINTGAEIGIYHTDRILSPSDYDKTIFFGADEEEMLPCSFQLYDKNGDYIRITKRHWWLTAFLTGCFSRPSDLYMEISIVFPDYEMLDCFIDGMYLAGYSAKDFSVCGLLFTFTFCTPKNASAGWLDRFWCRFSQWKNKLFCKLYLWITKPFCNAEDRILYLYYYLPFAFRRILRLHRFKKKRKYCRRKRA